MRILLCDDDKLILEQLCSLIRIYFERTCAKCPEIACYSDGTSLLADTGGKDIVFLDVEMPGLNGIYVGIELKKMNEGIIIFIITSYTEYLDDVMRFHVFRYLYKTPFLVLTVRNSSQLYYEENSLTFHTIITLKKRS